jgi:hypothetical protein
MAWLVLLGEIGFLRDATRQLLILAQSHGQAIKVSGATGPPSFFEFFPEMPGAAMRRRSPAQPYVARFIGCQCSCLPFLPNLDRNCPVRSGQSRPSVRDHGKQFGLPFFQKWLMAEGSQPGDDVLVSCLK